MGLFSSSSSSSETKNFTSTENISDVNDSAVYSDVENITKTDFNAIDNAFNFGGEALTDILDFGSEVIGNQRIQLSDSLKSINAATGNDVLLDGDNKKQAKALILITTAIGLLYFLGSNK